MSIQHFLSNAPKPSNASLDTFAQLLLDRDSQKFIIKDVNDAFLHLFSPICRRPREQLLQKPFLSIAPDSDLKKLLPLLKQPNAQPSLDLAFPFGNENTNVLWVRFFLSTDFYEGESVCRLTALDISDLKQAAVNANNANEMKSLFLATLSHEIRTPMQPIYGLLELMANQTDDPDLLGNIQTAKVAASGLLQILDDVLDLAKAEAGKMELDNFEVPLRTLLEGVVATLNVKAMEKGLPVDYTIDPFVPKVIRGDPKRLRQILTNLLSNAIKFTHNGSVTLTVTANQHNDDESHYTIRFEVQDTGIGMPPSVQDKLFQPFTQADTSTTRKYGGTGLGLSICQRLVDLMKGKIGVWSEEDIGSTFWFEIPTISIDTSLMATTNDSDGNQRLPDLTDYRILLVEDHPQGSQSIMLSLRSMGAKADCADTAQEGINFLSQNHYDIVIIDHALPDDSGLDVLQYAATALPNAGLIYHTVYDTSEIQNAVKSHGAVYLSKPSSRLGLAEAIESLLKNEQQEPANGSTRLLILEDNVAIRDLLRRQLSMLGVEAVDFAENGKEGLIHSDKNKYGLIISDLHMPEMDGYGFINALRQQKADTTPVIALTADVQITHNKAYSQHGFDGYLLKPISLDQLRRALQRWCLLGAIKTHKETPPPIIKHDMALIDQNAIARQFGQFNQDSLEMLDSFITCTTPQIHDLCENLQNLNHPEVYEIAHSLKGSARMAGCMRLGSIAERLQEKAKEKTLTVQDSKLILSTFKDTANELEKLKQA
jgi:signal transduction histidine kinase/DNA-binding response OmpR family regulator/HPt (histidine-containing phosphotransfer) domain-containing protein